ncbi:hypothetical protein V6N13_110220 [Hibiscus sabdariffa]
MASVEFYKLSLQWGRSTCSDGKTRCPTPLPPSIDQKFTIHGLWPQDANDNPVDPYDSRHPCVPQPPTPLTPTLFNPLRPDLDNEWPNLKNPVPNENMQFWTEEWNKHGTCSDFAHNPVKYFDSARQIRQSLPDFGIRPGDQGKVEDVIELVKAFTGAEPEIACNRNSITKDVQLWEIRLCYDKPDPQGQGGLVHQIRNCPFPLSHYPGELKLQLEAFFSYVILRLAQGKYGASYQQQEIAMKALADFCRQKTFMVEIVNCPLSAMHILALDGVMAERIGNGSVSSEQAPVILRECLSGGENTSKDV